MGARTYPQQRINDAWMLELAGHFHDTAAGTATPRAYQFAWNDDVIVVQPVCGGVDRCERGDCFGAKHTSKWSSDSWYSIR